MYIFLRELRKFGYWRIAEYANSKYATLAQWLFWAIGTWKIANAGRGFFLNSSYLPKDRSCKRNSIVISHQSGKIDFYHRRGDYKQHYTQTNFVTNYHTSHLSSKGPFSFLKDHSLSKRPVSSLSLLRWYLSLKFKPPKKLFDFSLGISMYTGSLHVCITDLFIFLLLVFYY